MAATEIELVGMDALIRMLATGGSKAPDALARGLHEEAQIIFMNSQAQVPFDEGVLSASGQIHPPAIAGGSIVVEITYGGNASNYAAEQHENLSYRHDPGRKAKYLEDPFNDALSGFDNRLAKRVDAIVRGLI